MADGCDDEFGGDTTRHGELPIPGRRGAVVDVSSVPGTAYDDSMAFTCATYTGRIRVAGVDAGEILGIVVERGLGVFPPELGALDVISDEFVHGAATFLDVTTGGMIRTEVLERAGIPFSCDEGPVLNVEHVKLRKPYQGSDLGLDALRVFLSSFEWTFAFSEIASLNEFRHRGFSTSLCASEAILVRHFERLHFRRVQDDEDRPNRFHWLARERLDEGDTVPSPTAHAVRYEVRRLHYLAEHGRAAAVDHKSGEDKPPWCRALAFLVEGCPAFERAFAFVGK